MNLQTVWLARLRSTRQRMRSVGERSITALTNWGTRVADALSVAFASEQVTRASLTLLFSIVTK